MKSLILSSTARVLLPILALFSLFLLLKGHHGPGGGFAGGLVAAATWALYIGANEVPAARRLLIIQPRTLIGVGLLIAAGSGIAPLVAGRPLMEGQWTSLHVPLLGQVYLGTPLLFDVGVYLVVVGVMVTVTLTLAEE
jgi:multicomponent Na+:H+ antiporter subunit B